MSYGLPTGTRISYGAPGFPDWVSTLANHFGLKASTYPSHQESDRIEDGFARNPQHKNRGIDWTGSVDAMQSFADHLATVKDRLEQVIWSNPVTGQRLGVAGGRDVTITGYYASDYAGHRDHVHTRQSHPIPIPGGSVTNRPDYNEWPMWSPANQSRGGVKIDSFFLHTQEGGGGDAAAENLANYLGNPAHQSSYHYAIRQASDGGVTVVDVVDTDLASWSVLSANNRSINLCFAGSRASWSHEQWMQQSKAIDVAAYLAVQDCEKYGFPAKVIAPPYDGRLPGITDHRYVTKILKDGTHTDVGDQFPWDYFTARVEFWAGGGVEAPPNALDGWDDRELLVEVLRQLRGPTLNGWPQLGGKSLVDAVAELRKAL